MTGNQRSQKAERVLEAFAAIPLLEQAVYYSPQYLDGRVEKEVCDLLLVHRERAIAVSLKAQDKQRSPIHSKRWAMKHLPKSLAQLRGAGRTLRERPIWCEHSTLGRRDFAPGTLEISHGLALLEVEDEAVLRGDSTEDSRGKSEEPTSVMSVADFLHLLRYLRTWRDLSDYLKARASTLTVPDSLTVGAEVPLLGYYTAMRDSFCGCRGIADAKIVTARGEHVRQHSAYRDQEMHFASAFEDVLRNLSIDEDVSLLPFLEQPESKPEVDREQRILIRENLCELTVQERAALGKQICQLSMRAREERDDTPIFGGVRFARHPKDAYMIVYAEERDREALRIDSFDLIVSYCIYHKKSRGFVFSLNQISDRIVADALCIDNIQPSLEMQIVGEERFGHIRAWDVTTSR